MVLYRMHVKAVPVPYDSYQIGDGATLGMLCELLKLYQIHKLVHQK